MEKKNLIQLTIMGLFVAITTQLIMNYEDIYRNYWKWHEVPYAQDNFQVQFPGEPQSETQTIPIPDKNINATLHMNTVSNPGTTFNASAVTYPDTFVIDPVASLDGAKKGSLDKMKAIVLEETKATSNGLPAIKIHGKVGDKAEIDALYVVKGQKLYMLMVLYEKTRHQEDAEKFFNSFQIK